MPQNISSVEDVQRQLDNAVARIHEDLDLRDEAKNRMIEEVHEEARSRVAREVQEGREDLEADLKVARRMAFAPPPLTVTEGRRPDPAYVARWYSDEVDRVREMREPTQLEHEFQQAMLTNNVVRAKAILVRAYELQNDRLVGLYFESFPEERDVWDNFVEAAQAYNSWEKASHLFSASSRLRPLEHYLA
jgi:hypothetical protein